MGPNFDTVLTASKSNSGRIYTRRHSELSKTADFGAKTVENPFFGVRKHQKSPEITPLKIDRFFKSHLKPLGFPEANRWDSSINRPPKRGQKRQKTCTTSFRTPFSEFSTPGGQNPGNPSKWPINPDSGRIYTRSQDLNWEKGPKVVTGGSDTLASGATFRVFSQIPGHLVGIRSDLLKN